MFSLISEFPKNLSKIKGNQLKIKDLKDSLALPAMPVSKLTRVYNSLKKMTYNRLCITSLIFILRSFHG